MLSDRDLQELRDTARLGMPDRFRLLRPTEEEDPMGGVIPGEPEDLGEEVCAVTTSVSSAALVGDDQRTSADAVFTIPGDSPLDILPSDQIQLVGGSRYEVQGYAERTGAWQIRKRVLAARV